jgi:hypothetical protein
MLWWSKRPPTPRSDLSERPEDDGIIVWVDPLIAAEALDDTILTLFP